LEQKSDNKPDDSELISELNKLSKNELKDLLKEIKNVPEIEVLIASAIWLWNHRKVHPIKVSVATGKGIDFGSHKKQLVKIFETVGIPLPRFKNDGPDIIGSSESEFWQVECKGAGLGKVQTYRNNFDRALASVVSYYTDISLDERNSDARPYLGLALPDTPDYVSELHRRVKKPLRHQLNLWVLLYEQESKQIRPVTPGDEY
jgi:hypothetical protein